jgi:hypothetical protein
MLKDDERSYHPGQSITLPEYSTKHKGTLFVCLIKFAKDKLPYGGIFMIWQIKFKNRYFKKEVPRKHFVCYSFTTA